MVHRFRPMSVEEVLNELMLASSENRAARFRGYEPYDLLETNGMVQPYATFAVYKQGHQFLYTREERDVLHHLHEDEMYKAIEVLRPGTRWDLLRIDKSASEPLRDLAERRSQWGI